jgi:hypothetical protein
VSPSISTSISCSSLRHYVTVEQVRRGPSHTGPIRYESGRVASRRCTQNRKLLADLWVHQRLLEPIGNVSLVEFEQHWSNTQHTDHAQPRRR